MKGKDAAALFLERYKQLETDVMAKRGISVFDFENGMPESPDKDRLKTCRIMRNYMQHNDLDFLSPSIKQCDFLQKMSEQVTGRKTYARDAMKRVRESLQEKDNIQAAFSKLSNSGYSFAPLTDTHGQARGVV